MRTTIEAMAAVLGGTQSLHTNGFDEALALPTPISARIARNTQLILAEETGITHVIDPLGGLVLRREPDRGARARGAEADRRGRGARRHDPGDRGGHAEAPHRGVRATRRQARIDRGEDVVVGVNKYRTGGADRGRDARHRQRGGARYAGRSGSPKMRATRDPARCKAALAALEAGARGDEREHLLALAVDAARARATVGEISDALERVWGRHRARGAHRLRRLRRGLPTAIPTSTRCARGPRRSPTRRAAGRACSSRSSARTATIAARR